MLQTLIVPLDGSPLAERALPYATALAKATAVKIVLVRAAIVREFPGRDVIDAQVKATNEAETYLTGIVEKLRADGITAEWHVYGDEAANAILDLTRRLQGDLIVMSTHGRSGFGRMIYGSVADQVLREAEAPVFLLPASCCARQWPTDRPVHILVPLDGSKLAEEMLAPAADLIGAIGGELTLLRVVQPPYYAYPEAAMYPYPAFEPEPELKDAEKYLESIAAPLRATGKAVRVMTTVGSPVLEIAAVAEEQEVDAVAMATHGHGGLARLVLGSVATATLQRSDVPLLVMRPAALRQPVAPTPEPIPEPLEPVAHVALSKTELDLVQRGLSELIYHPERDAKLAVPARTLLARLQQAGEVASSGEPISAGQS